MVGHKALEKKIKECRGSWFAKIGGPERCLCGKSDHTVNIQRAGLVVKEPLNRG